MITIKNYYEPRPGHKATIKFLVEDSTVEIFEAQGDHQSMMTYLGRHITLWKASHADFADLDSLESYLRSEHAQAILRIIQDNHSVEWDGSNHRGKLTSEGGMAVEELRDNLEDRTYYLPTAISAYDCYVPAGLRGMKLWEEISGYGGLKEAVTSEVSTCLPCFVVQEDDLEGFFRKELEELASELQEDIRTGHSQDPEEDLETIKEIQAFLAEESPDGEDQES